MLAAAQAFIAAHAADGAAIVARHSSQARYQPAFTQLVMHDGQTVGAALLSHHRMRLSTATLEIGRVSLFIDQASDVAAVRTRLIGSMLGVCQESALPFAMLHGAPTVFAPFGFAPYRLATVIAHWHSGPALTPVRPLVHADIDDLGALQTASSALLPIAALRTPADWHAWLADQTAAFGLDDATGRLVAYASITNSQVVEAAAADAGAARALLAALPPGCQLALELRHPLAQAALHTGGSATVRGATADRRAGQGHEAPLAGIVDLAGALGQIAPACGARLAASRYADWSGRVQIASSGTQVTLVCAHGQVTIAHGPQPADVHMQRVTLHALPPLCLGHRAVSDLRATGDLDCDDAALGLLETLFPVV